MKNKRGALREMAWFGHHGSQKGLTHAQERRSANTLCSTARAATRCWTSAQKGSTAARAPRGAEGQRRGQTPLQEGIQRVVLRQQALDGACFHKGLPQRARVGDEDAEGRGAGGAAGRDARAKRRYRWVVVPAPDGP